MADKLQQTIYDAITSSSELKPGNYVSVAVKKTSLFGKKQIQLSGRANSEADKAKIEEIAKGLAEGLEVVSTIRLGRTG
jgi:hypothetical protein